MHWLPSALSLALTLVWTTCLSSAASAQVTTGKTVVITVATAPGRADEQHVADRVEAALSARGVQVVSMHDARDRIQAQSRPPVAPDNSDLDALAREARAAIEHVAFGRAQAAQRSVEEVFRRAERALESLNRETKTARHVLDACLALVRSTLARGAREDALAEAMRCRRMVPDVAPSEFLHPASVVGVLAEADNQLRRMRIGRLSVTSKPESRCDTYVNGRHLGVTPFLLERAVEGEYRVQVECGRAAGRVHLVQLGETPAELIVDAEFDRALHSEGRVALVYDSASQVGRLARQHGVQVARSVRAEEVVLIGVAGGYAELSRLSVSQGTVLGRSRLAWAGIEDSASPELVRALDALFEGRLEGEARIAPAVVAAPAAPSVNPLVAPEPALAPPLQESPQRAPALRVRRMRIAAAAIAGTGAALLFTGIAFEHQRKRADDELYRLLPSEWEAIARAQEDYDRAERLRWLGLGGGALLVAAVPLLRVDVSRGVRWWSYVAGAAGLGLGAWGSVELAKHGGCEVLLTTGACADTRESVGKGALLLAGALPLLALPIDHFIEWRLHARRARMHAKFAFGPQHALLITMRTEL